MEALLAWSATEGITVHENITLLEPGSFGTQGTALHDIPANSTLCRIPLGACLTPRLASDFFRLSFEVLQRENLEGAALGMYVVTCLSSHAHMNRAGRTRWSAYIDSLPPAEELDTLDFWRVQECAWLRGTGIMNDVVDRQARWKEQLRRVLALLGWSGEVVSWDVWVYVMTLLSTRSFPSSLIPDVPAATTHSPPGDPTATDVSSGKDDSAASHPILLPVLDTFNHTTPLAIQWISSPTHVSFISGSTPIRAGTQVFNNYGNKSTSEFLMTYGFLSGPSVLSLGVNGKRYIMSHDDLVPDELIRDAMGAADASRKRRLVVMVHVLNGLLVKRDGMTWHDESPSGPGFGSRSLLRWDIAKRYRDGQRGLCQASIEKLQCMIRAVLVEQDEQVVTIDKCFKDTDFVEAIGACFGVETRHDAEASELSDVLLALHLCHTKSVERINVTQDQAVEAEEEQSEQIEDLWQQVQACVEVAPRVFGTLNESLFKVALLKVWNVSTEFDGTLYIFLD